MSGVPPFADTFSICCTMADRWVSSLSVGLRKGPKSAPDRIIAKRGKAPVHLPPELVYNVDHGIFGHIHTALHEIGTTRIRYIHHS